MSTRVLAMPLFSRCFVEVGSGLRQASHRRPALCPDARLIGKLTKEGIASGELSPKADPYEMASVVTSTLEGAEKLSRLFDDPVHMQRVVEHAKRYVPSLARNHGSRDA